MPVSAGMYYFLSEQGKPGSIPLILIHGAGGSYLGWHIHLRRMPGVNVYALDLPGHGKSAGEGRHSIEAYARDIIDFMQSTGIYQAILVGHSLGGMISLQAALLQPERVTGLVIVSSAAYCAIPEDVVQGLLTPLTYPQSLHWLVEHLAGGTDSAEWVEATRRSIGATRQGVLYGDLIACRSADLTDRVAGIEQDTLVCYGDQDQLYSPRSSSRLAESMPHAKLAAFPGYGHLLPLENPDGLAAAITHHFPDLSARQPA